MKKLYIIWYILAAVILIVAAVLLIRRIRRIRNERLDALEQPVKDWVNQLWRLNGHSWTTRWHGGVRSARKAVALGEPPMGTDRYRRQDLLKKAIIAQDAAKLALKHHAEDMARNARLRKVATRALTKALALKTDAERLDALGDVYADHEGHFSRANESLLKAELSKLITQRVGELEQRLSAGGSKSDLEELTDLVDLYYDTRLIWDKYAYPAQWDDWIARFYHNPKLDQFKIVGKNPKSGAILLMGGEAIMEASLTKAKIVLAFCNSERRDVFRSEVGSSLRGRLAEFIAQTHDLSKIDHAQQDAAT